MESRRAGGRAGVGSDSGEDDMARRTGLAGIINGITTAAGTVKFRINHRLTSFFLTLVSGG
jgi:hypothetical protein